MITEFCYKEKKVKYKEWEKIINNWIFNAFSPSVTDLIKLEISKYFKIIVKKGKEKPYFYKDGEGFNSRGVYIRIGSSKRIASFDEIQRMLSMRKANEFEQLNCGARQTHEY